MAGRKEKIILGSIRRLLNGTARLSQRRAGALGYYLLSKPRRAADEPLSDDHMRVAERHTIRVGKTELQCFRWPADGPGVLLLHGWESNSGRWYDFYEPLRRAGYDLYAFDAPAHGRSGGSRFSVMMYAEALHAYLNKLPGPPPYWIGHSAGGMAAIYYLSQHGAAHEPEQLVTLAVPGELENFIDKFCEVIGVREKVKRGIDDQFRRKLALSFADISFVNYAKQLRIPGLIIHDEYDDLAPITGARLMHANWVGSTLLTTRGLGHSLIGAEVPARILEYLGRCRRPRGGFG